MAKGDLNPAIWSPTVLTLHTTWRLCGWCWLAVGLREVFRDHSNFQAACSSMLLAVVCCHLPYESQVHLPKPGFLCVWSLNQMFVCP